VDVGDPRGEDYMIDGVNDDYAASVGSVMKARNEYDAAVTEHGADSPEALELAKYLELQVEQRDIQRVKHDEAEDGPRRSRKR
jgi:hypothetical protein